MPRTSSNSATSALSQTLDNLTSFQWPQESVLFDETTQDDLDRFLRDIQSENYGRDLSDLEEQYERSRWMRTNAVRMNLDAFRLLLDICHNFVNAIMESQQISALGKLARLPHADQDERPTAKIPFQPIEIPDRPSLSFSDFQRFVGGSHAVGARLLWWSAAAHTPTTFGYSADFAIRLMNLPIWFRDQPDGTCLRNIRPLELMREAAKRISRSEIIEVDPEATERDGPLLGKEFRLLGKVFDLTPQAHKALSLLWNSRWKKVPSNKFENVIWPDEPPVKGTVSSAITRINKQLINADLPGSVIVMQRDGMVMLEIIESGIQQLE